MDLSTIENTRDLKELPIIDIFVGVFSFSLVSHTCQWTLECRVKILQLSYHIKTMSLQHVMLIVENCKV